MKEIYKTFELWNIKEMNLLDDTGFEQSPLFLKNDTGKMVFNFFSI